MFSLFLENWIDSREGKVFWYNNDENLIENVEKALKSNRLEKAEKNK